MSFAPDRPKQRGQPEQVWLARDRRPDGVDDDTVEAVGKLGEALEWIERARGRLYDFHQMSGHSDLLVGEAADAFEEAGLSDVADHLRTELVGRNVLEGRWTFQIVEEYDATYWAPARALLRDVEDRLVGGMPHVYESEMKERRRTHGHPRHTARPTTITPASGSTPRTGSSDSPSSRPSRP